MGKAKRKRRNYAPDMDEHTKAVIDEAIRIRTRMQIRDHMGKERVFRSTVAEEQERAQDTAQDETEEDGG